MKTILRTQKSLSNWQGWDVVDNVGNPKEEKDFGR